MDIITILRTPKIFDMALFDWFSVFLGIYYINEYLVKKYSIKNRNQLDFFVLTIMILLGIFTHNIFNIKTKFNYYMGLSEDPRPINILK